MTPFIWITERVAMLLHDQQIAEHGGSHGVRDQAAVLSALARPLNLLAYGSPDAADLAAAYAYGLIKTHGFVDGNKRIGFLVAATFLDINGYDLSASEEDVVHTVLAVAAGEKTETALADWFRASIRKRANG